MTQSRGREVLAHSENYLQEKVLTHIPLRELYSHHLYMLLSLHEQTEFHQIPVLIIARPKGLSLFEHPYSVVRK